MALPRRPRRPHWRYTLRQILWAGLDLIFPPRCGGCQTPHTRFCAACRASLTFISPPLCQLCGYPSAASHQRTCVMCRTSPELAALTGLRSAVFFEGALRQAIHGLKYRRDFILADTLAEVLAKAWKRNSLPEALVTPVPLSAERLRQRGYNQAALLAQSFAERLGLPYTPESVQRTRNTVSQVELSVAERRANVAGAFVGQPNLVMDKTLILIDDVCTTGATLVACAQALRAAGAEAVWGLTLARARHSR